MSAEILEKSESECSVDELEQYENVSREGSDRTQDFIEVSEELNNESKDEDSFVDVSETVDSVESVANNTNNNNNNCEVRIHKDITPVQHFKLKSKPRLIAHFTEQDENKFKRNFTSPYSVRKPVGISVRKPKTDKASLVEDLPTTKEGEPQPTNSKTKELGTCLVERDGDGMDTESIDIMENENCDSIVDTSCDSISQQFHMEPTEETDLEIESEHLDTGSKNSENDCENDQMTSTEVNQHETETTPDDDVKTTNIDTLHSVCRDLLINRNYNLLSTNEKDEESRKMVVETAPPNFSLHSCLGAHFNSKLLTGKDEDILPVKEQLGATKLKSLHKILERSPEGVDMKLSLFVSACAHNMKSLHPFPHSILKDNDVNRHLLYYIVEEIPSVEMISFLLKAKETEVLRKELFPIIEWVVRSEDPRLDLVKEEDHKSTMELVSDFDSDSEERPTHIFRIKHRRESEVELSWRKVKQDKETKFAFHNSCVEEAHTVLYYGANNRLNRSGIYGPGIYLTDNLAACIESCLPGNTWGKSSLATRVKLTFIAEFIPHHSVVSYCGQGHPFMNDSKSGEKSIFKYYFVRKPKLVRLRFLLVYVVKASIIPKGPFQISNIRKNMVRFLTVLRISLLVGAIIMGASASTNRPFKSPTLLLNTMQKCYDKVSTVCLEWPGWQYIEKPSISTTFGEGVITHGGSSL